MSGGCIDKNNYRLINPSSFNRSKTGKSRHQSARDPSATDWSSRSDNIAEGRLMLESLRPRGNPQKALRCSEMDRITRLRSNSRGRITAKPPNWLLAADFLGLRTRNALGRKLPNLLTWLPAVHKQFVGWPYFPTARKPKKTMVGATGFEPVTTTV